MNKNRNKTTYLFSFFLLIFHLMAAGQDSKHLTLEQAIESSIKNSKQLRISNARVDDAIATVQAAKDNQLPGFSVSASYLRLGFADINLKKSASSGAAGSSGSTASPSQAMYGIANLSLPLYSGGRIKYGIESAKYLQQAVSLDGEHDRDAIVYNTVGAYINLFKAQQAVTIVKAELNASLSRDTTLSNLERNGILARNDLLKSQLQTSNIEAAVLEAENGLSLAMVNMNLMLGQPENTIITIDSSFINADSRDEKAFSDYQSLALQNRKDLQAVAYRKKASAIGIKSAKAEAYPNLSLSGGYIAADVPAVLTVTNAMNIGIGIQYNLASIWKKNTKLMQAKAMQTQVSAAEEMLNDGVRLQVNQDYRNYILSKKKIEVFEKSVGQAAENFKIVNNKFNNSLATITDLLEANVSLLQAKLNIQAARADAVLAYQKLLQTTGLLKY